MTIGVLQVVPRLDAGGVERTTLEVAEALSAQGHKACVYSEGGRLEPELAAAGGVLARGPAASKSPWDWFVAGPARIATVCREQNLDLIHARSRAPAWSALIAARRLGLPFVTTYHGIYNAKGAVKRWYNSVMARGDAVIANSRFTADHLIAEHGTDPAKVHVIYRGVDVEAFDRAAVSPQRVEALRAAWGVAAEDPRPVIVLPGRLTEWKGQRTLIEAVARLRGQGIESRALLVGDAQGREGYVSDLDALAAREGVADLVHRTGHCADMPAAFMLADVVATPSTEPEAFGRTAAEAQAMEVPVVASDLGAARETVDPAVCGRLSAPGDPAALAGALAALLAMDRPARAAMGAAGAARVRSLFTKRALQRDTLRLYHAMIHSQKGKRA